MPDLLSNTLAFVFALGVIIFVHEAGHLVVAKIFDTRVLTFSQASKGVAGNSIKTLRSRSRRSSIVSPWLRN